MLSTSALPQDAQHIMSAVAVSSQSLIIENSFPVDDLLGDRVDDDKQHSNQQQLQGLTQQYPTPTTTTSHPQVKQGSTTLLCFFAAVLSCLSFPSYLARLTYPK
jgi:hypothetical protein